MRTFLLTLVLFLSTPVFGETLRPQTVKEFQQTSVRIYGLSMKRGGTGSIFKSFKSGSHILTNKHVCRIIEQGGYVVRGKKRYLITHYKKFPDHDLCLVRVPTNFDINLVIADGQAQQSQASLVSGHPSLLPHILTKGHLSAEMTIKLVTGIKDCDKSDYERSPMKCMFFRGIPVVKDFEARVVSNFIQPGSSGSAVFSEAGEIIGVAFAGRGRGISHGFVVPHRFVSYFTSESKRFEWVKVGTEVDSGEYSLRFFNKHLCTIIDSVAAPNLSKFCINMNFDRIWSK